MSIASYFLFGLIVFIWMGMLASVIYLERKQEDIYNKEGKRRRFLNNR